MRASHRLEAAIASARRQQEAYGRLRDDVTLQSAADAWVSIVDGPEFQVAPRTIQGPLAEEAGDFFLAVAEDTSMVLALLGAGRMYDIAFRRAPTPAQREDCRAKLIEVLPTLGEIGQSYMRHAADEGDQLSIEKAVEILSQTLPWVPEDMPALQSALMGELGAAFLERFKWSGEAGDLDEAVALSDESLELVAPDNVDRANALVDASNAYSVRYRLRGSIADLERSLELSEEALALAEQHGLAGTYTHNLASSLLERYEATGQVTDLERGIELLTRALAAAEAGSPYHSMVATSLGNAYANRFMLERRADDVEAMIASYDAALPGAPPGRERAGALQNLGNAHRQRYATKGDRAALERAVELGREAVAATPTDSPYRAGPLGSLGDTLTLRYQLTRNRAELDEAVDVLQSSVAATPADGPDMPSRLSSLGGALALRQLAYGDHRDVERGVEAFRSAVEQARTGRLQYAVPIAASWGDWALMRESLDESAEAFGAALDAMTQLFRGQVNRADKEAWLRMARGVPVATAFARARSGNILGAVEALEGGRALLLSEVLEQDRRDLDRLGSAGHEDLRVRYSEAAAEWARLVQADKGVVIAPDDGSAQRPDSTPGQVRAARRTLDAVIEEIRRVRGYERFLMTPTFSQVFADAGEHPLVYLATTRLGGFALVVGIPLFSATVLWLPELTDDAVSAQVHAYGAAYEAHVVAGGRAELESWSAAIDEVTRWLWHAAIGPILKVTGPALRTTLVPGGQLGLLPLHAAWTEDESRPTGRRYALDDRVVAFAPNARAVRLSRERADAAVGRHLVAVDEPDLGDVDERLRLPYSGNEVAAAVAVFPDHEVLAGADATEEAVLAALGRAEVFHLSCHGRAEPQQPLESFLALAANEPLTVRDILRQRLGARLGVLSACETAVAGDVLPDEVVSLPTALLQAGAAATIGSLWSVPGFATALLMMRFYDGWNNGSDDPATALRDAQAWVRDTTNGEKADWLESIQPGTGHPLASAVGTMFREIALDPDLDADARDYAAPYHWAAFTYVGA